MLELDKERANKMPLSEQQILDKEKSDGLLTKAQQIMDEDHDDVKHMNQMMLYSKCVTIRDAQLLEKQLIQHEQMLVEQRIDMAMEQERQKAIRIYEERDIKRMAERRQGAIILKKQIQER